MTAENISSEGANEVPNNKDSTTVVIENNEAIKDENLESVLPDNEGEEIAKKTIEEVVTEIVGTPTVWSVLFVVVAMSYGLSVDSLSYLTVFAGYMLDQTT